MVPLAPDGADTDFASMVRRMLEALGEDPEREGLIRTPARVEASMRWLTRGYNESVDDVVRDIEPQ